MSNASFAINEQDFDRFMLERVIKSINKYIKQATPGYKSRTVKNPSYYGIHKQQFRVGHNATAAMCKQVEQTVEAVGEDFGTHSKSEDTGSEDP